MHDKSLLPFSVTAVCQVVRLHMCSSAFQVSGSQPQQIAFCTVHYRSEALRQLFLTTEGVDPNGVQMPLSLGLHRSTSTSAVLTLSHVCVSNNSRCWTTSGCYFGVLADKFLPHCCIQFFPPERLQMAVHAPVSTYFRPGIHKRWVGITSITC